MCQCRCAVSAVVVRKVKKIILEQWLQFRPATHGAPGRPAATRPVDQVRGLPHRKIVGTCQRFGEGEGGQEEILEREQVNS